MRTALEFLHLGKNPDMKKFYSLFAFVCISAYSQQLPYLNNFDLADSETGWSHHAISGTDSWGRGTVTGGVAGSGNFAWQTGLGAMPATSSNMVLESPSFDLTNAALPYVLSFNHRSSLNGSLYLEYSTDNGVIWQVLNPATTLKKNWQSAGGFSTSVGTYVNAALNLSFLQGNANVKFRFRCVTNSYVNNFGWIIDDFSIAPEYYNIFASSGEPIEISPLCPQIEIKTGLGFSNQYTAFYNITTKYYLSTDISLDGSDIFLGEQSTNTGGTINSWNFTATPPSGLAPGQYYVIYNHDANNVLAENSETDNIGYCSLIVKPIFNLPYSIDFESENANWKAAQSPQSTTEMLWERGDGQRHHIEKSHSGSAAWHTSKTTIEHPEYTFQWVETPYFNLAAAAQPLYLSFWFKDEYPSGVDYYDNNYFVQYSIDCNPYWTTLTTVPQNQSDEWEFINIPLNATISASENVRFRITYQGNYLGPEGIIFDDFYVGAGGSDLTIEKIYSNKRHTLSSSASDVLTYNLVNGGTEPVANSKVKFYWSADETLDGSDTLLGEQAISNFSPSYEWRQFNYTKPTSAAGNYFILYQLDPDNQVTEIRENNNAGAIPVEQLPVAAYPYFNDFETDANQWAHEATLGVDEWGVSVPQDDVLNSAFSGTKAWISRPQGGPVSSMSRMHLYTPAFDLSSSENPVLEFDMKYDGTGGCSCFNITLNMSYSTDAGATWTVLEPTNDSYAKWYESMEYSEDSGTDIGYGANYTKKMFAPNEPAFTTYKQYNSRDIDRNTRYIVSIPQLKDETNVRFRFNLSTEDNSDQAEINGGNHGALIDNFAIKEGTVELNVPYQKTLYLSSLATKMNFAIDVKNDGDYISNATDIKFYLSADNVYDAADQYLGNADLGAIRPDFKKHLSLEYPLPANLASYNYLVYVIDGGNANIETDETNNSGAWNLGLQGINTFPYAENFEGDVVNGWHGYSYDPFDTTLLAEYRVTNRIAVSDDANTYRRNFNGILRTEYVPYGSWQDYNTPTYYIVSPAFDFTSYNDPEPLTMAFDYMCIGSITHNGGNMQYSTNGGATWTLLTTNSGSSINWYPNYQTMDDMNNQPGWYGYDSAVKTAVMNISFLQGQSNVLFRVKYYSNYASAADQARGFRLDNFVIGGTTMANELSCIEPVPSDMMTFDNFQETCWELGSNDDDMILLDRNVNPDIHWEITDHFAGESGNASAKVDLVGQGNTNGVWLISPKYSMVSGAKLRFNIALTGLNTSSGATIDSDDQIDLLYSTDNGINWASLKTWTAATPVPAQGQLVQITSLPSAGFVRFAFKATNGAANNGSNTTFYVDDFKLFTGALGVPAAESFDFAFYPNPVKSIGYIKASETIERVRVLGISGQTLFESRPNASEFMIDMSKFPTGVYFIVAESGEKIRHLKIIRQ